MKPVRQFSADAGDQSIGLKGPDAIEADLDKIMKMFDPNATHTDGSSGGIAGENFAQNSIGTLALEDAAVTAPKVANGAILDSKIGNRTINDALSAMDTGTLSQLLGALANRIKGITGSGNWKDVAPDTISGLLEKISTAQATVNAANAAATQAIAQALSAINSANIANNKSDNAINIAQGAVGQANTATNIANSAVNTSNEAAASVASAVESVNIAVAAAQQAVILAQTSVGNTEIKADVFTIINPNLGNDTFTYSDNGVTKTGQIVSGRRRFTLNDSYHVNMNRITAVINDALERSAASGGLTEVGATGQLSNIIELASSVAAGTEITFKYFKQISLSGKHAMSHNVGGSDALVIVSQTEPAETFPGLIWLKVVQ